MILEAAFAPQQGRDRRRLRQAQLVGDRGRAQVEIEQHRAQFRLPSQRQGQVHRRRGLAAFRQRRGDGQPPPAVLAHLVQDLGAQHVEGRRFMGRALRQDARPDQGGQIQFDLWQGLPPGVRIARGGHRRGRLGHGTGLRRDRRGGRRGGRSRGRGFAALGLALPAGDLDGGLQLFHDRVLPSRLSPGPGG